jgi:hypothetical protein
MNIFTVLIYKIFSAFLQGIFNLTDGLRLTTTSSLLIHITGTDLKRAGAVRWRDGAFGANSSSQLSNKSTHFVHCTPLTPSLIILTIWGLLKGSFIYKHKFASNLNF